MSSWSLLLACQGFIYDGPAGVIGFTPVWKPEDHVSFFTAAESYGLFIQRRDGQTQTDRIDVREGRLAVKTIVLQAPEGVESRDVGVEKSGSRIKSQFANTVGTLRINLDTSVSIREGEALNVKIVW